jgi:hypothetical protein
VPLVDSEPVTDLQRLAMGVDSANGAGVTTAELFDRRGFIGTSAQTLLIQRR